MSNNFMNMNGEMQVPRTLPLDGATDWFAKDGIGSFGLNAIGGAAGLYMGMKNYGLMKDQLKFGKRVHQQNWAAQAITHNGRQEDIARARYASNPNAYQSVGDHMQQNRIDENPNNVGV